jgi:hypothetical protein
MVVLRESIRLVAARYLPLYGFNILAVILHLAYVRYETYSKLSINMAVQRIHTEQTFVTAYREHSCYPPIRFPELRLLRYWIAGRPVQESVDEGQSFEVECLLVLTARMLLYPLIVMWLLHCGRSVRRLIIRLVGGRVLHALIGARWFLPLEFTNALMYLLVVMAVI